MILKFLSGSKTVKANLELVPLVGRVELNRDRPYEPGEEFCSLCFDTSQGNRDIALTAGQAQSLYSATSKR